jgi:aspartyl-tRNA(Asn)/glutamyl-tRNA(Gln) amidotransferase subunit B
MNKNHIVSSSGKEWEVVIGLEIHAQVTSNSKLFSSSPTNFDAAPNTNVSTIDAALPGMLPVLNEKCIEQAVLTGLGLNAKINNYSVFDRKNYFYPDLPQGYQISQFYHPIVGKGSIDIELENGESKTVGITRIHLEQDAGKSIHDQSPNESFIDLNRCGIALMEIVTEPDMRSIEEAVALVKKLRSIVRYLGTCDGDMEKGSMRCDANISVRTVGSEKFGTRVEIKNLNSFKFIAKAIEYEISRQIDLIESGGQVSQETRLFDSELEETRTMRSKEDAIDYGYFPDPDLPPLVLSNGYIEKIRSKLPELPDVKKKRYMSDYGLSQYDTDVLISDRDTALFFEAVADKSDPKMAANWVTAELFGLLNKNKLEITNSPISPESLAELINLIKKGTISGKIAKQVFEKMFESGEAPNIIVDREGLVQLSDNSAIDKIVMEVIKANSDKVSEYRSGKDRLFAFFVGQVMAKTKGQANPQVVNEILKDKLSNAII